MLQQTKRHKDKLIEVGLERENLKVQTPCNHRGEYQKTKAFYHGPRERLLELKDELIKAGYIVWKTTIDSEFRAAGIMIPEYDEEPEFREMELKG